ncbi:cytochrome P450 [Coniophora puteana RWD-64-598 SS2]|uniref:Cytochrome P450 n=1 Tax=Coniophora puteana (strain RWD-64-598) TaxID=741705 RepID=A0A5M3MRJ9_CONPW|nr:cytochrome P450 [Coniophora puteana RWD-64-598 SS2]EIW81779.1 cytochrome P450 [Coniophora puteana RWD-64-598 SS2]
MSLPFEFPNLDRVHSLLASADTSSLPLLAACGTILVAGSAIALNHSRNSAYTRLRGPPSDSLLWGVSQKLPLTEAATAWYTQWEAEYGHVYSIPYTLGKERIVLHDPKAVAHFFTMDNSVYVKSTFTRSVIRKIAGEGIFADALVGCRQRKVLSPAFSNAAIRALSHVFYDCANKRTPLSSATGPVTDSNSSIDSIGMGGFSHDFRSLAGEKPIVAQMFDANDTKSSFMNMAPMLALVLPLVNRIPGPFDSKIKELNDSLESIADGIWEKMRRDAGSEAVEEKSIVGRLLRAQGSDTSLQLSREEVLDEIKVLILAGYITTSTSLTWCLIELAKNQEAQKKLRDELRNYDTDEPSYDDLMDTTKLPYLDAVTHETLRLHPAATELDRVAAVDDAIPLSTPITDARGRTTDHIAVPRGTLVAVPIAAVNRSPAFWGPDAALFRPERWLGGAAEAGAAKDLVGHRHLLTFASGPRTCIGKMFALAEFKTVLSVLARNFAFEFEGGDAQKITILRGRTMPGRMFVGEDGKPFALKVKRVSA